MNTISFEEFIQPVPLHVIEYQARRQAALRIPRRFETPECSASYTGQGFIRHALIKGFIYVEIPVDLLQVSKVDLCPERQNRLERIGGTDDPIWVFVDQDMASDSLIYSIIDGNNRTQYRIKRGMNTIPAFITGNNYKPLYQILKEQGMLTKQAYNNEKIISSRGK